MLIKKNYKNTATLQIDNLKKLFIKIDKNINRIQKIILNIYTIYTKYLNQISNAIKSYNQI